jgi:flagellar basal body-associated protein FliL
MAEEPRKDEPKKKLSFFKKAKPEPAAGGERTAVATAPAPDDVEAPSTSAADEAALEAWSQAGVEGDGAEGGVAAGNAGEGAGAGAANTDVKAEPKTARARKPLGLKLRMPSALGPSLGLAGRAMVILAIITADACAAFLVVKALAPMLVASRAEQAAAGATAAPAEEAKETREHEAAAGRENTLGTVDLVSDLVVNPAGTDGTRYLCTTVALETISPKVSEEIKSREAQIRDVLIEILSKRSIGDLADLGTRDDLRGEIMAGVNGLLTSGEVVGVYFSNFVLQ